MARTPVFWVYFSLLILIFVPIDFAQHVKIYGLLTVSLATLGAAVTYSVTHVVLVTIQSHIVHPASFMVYFPMISMILGTILAQAFYYSCQIFAVGLNFYDPAFIVADGVIIFVRLCLLEWIFHRYVMGVYAIDPKEQTEIQVGTQILTIADILYVQAREHHVCIATVHGNIIERARLRDLMQILSNTCGVQPHRSYWVRKRAVDHIVDTGAKSVICVRDFEIPIARTRLNSVLEWAEYRKIPIHTQEINSPSASYQTDNV